MFATFEATATWPTNVREVITVLIPKADGGLRPIALFRTAYRVYAKYRCQAVRQWAAKSSGYQCNNSKSRWVGDSTWRNQVRSAITDESSVSAEVLLDVRNAFESVRRQQLFSIVQNIGYPMRALIMSLRDYQWRRRVKYEGLVSAPIVPERGI
jgi:hypothetical protein